MKQCPACNRTYTDDELSFCLEDGAPLHITAGAPQQPSSFDSNADPYKTLAYTPRETSPPPMAVHPVAPTHPIPAPQPGWSPSQAPPYGVQLARKSGRAVIIWAIVGVALLAVGIIVLLAIIGKNSEDSGANANRTEINKNSNSVVSNANTDNRESTSSGSLKDDFSTENWPSGEGAFGSFYQDGEYHMVGKPKLYVFIFPRNSNNYRSEDATVKVTARSVDGKSPEYGYGLVIHGRINQARQLEGYGFLIYTGDVPKFEIVRFVAGEPKQIVAWKDSSAVRGGTSPNQIEVRASGSLLSFYINGQFADSITDTANLRSGYVGLYTSEINEVAFDDMEIAKQ